MVETVILSQEESKVFKEVRRLFSPLQTIVITLNFPKEKEFISYWNADTYTLENVFGKDIIPEIKNVVKLGLEKELEELNEKIKEFTTLKGEIEVLKKQIKENG